MNLVEVNDKKSRKAFLDVPKLLYKNEPNWTCPLDIEIDGIFNPDVNDCFKFGEAIRWVLKDEKGNLIGRLAAFYDERKKDHSYVSTGFIGFFECVNDQQAANTLFDSARNWLEQKGLKAMDGDANFGENLFHWGVLTEGFKPSPLGMNYHFPYYKELFEKYGFKEYFRQHSYLKDMKYPWPERQYKFAQYLASRQQYQLVHFTFENKDKFIDDVVKTFNTVWSDFHEDYTPLKREEIDNMFEDLKSVIDPELIWLCYTGDEPIGMVIGLPDLNQVLRKLKNGKLTLINKLKFFYHTKMKKTITGCRTVASGVVPEYQQKGVIAILFYQLSETLKKKGYRFMELAWTGDYNEPVINIYEQVGAEHYQTHLTYRYIFDKDVEFKRFTNEKGYKSRNK